MVGSGYLDEYMDNVSELGDYDGFEGEEEEDKENSRGENTKAGANDDKGFKGKEKLTGTAAFVLGDDSAYETRASKLSNTVQFYESKLERLKSDNSENLSAMVHQMEVMR